MHAEWMNGPHCERCGLPYNDLTGQGAECQGHAPETQADQRGEMAVWLFMVAIIAAVFLLTGCGGNVTPTGPSPIEPAKVQPVCTTVTTPDRTEVTIGLDGALIVVVVPGKTETVCK